MGHLQLGVLNLKGEAHLSHVSLSTLQLLHLILHSKLNYSNYGGNYNI